jgi:threonyl-tRNA synthetase
MITLKLPDGSAKEVAAGTSARQVAEGIGKRLAQAAIAAKVDGQIIDLARELPEGEHSFQILTEKDADALDVMRHSCAHVMARAVMRLFPGVQLAFGPTIDNGFYYDIDAPTPLKEDDFPKIEAEMKKIVEQAEPFERFERPTAEGRGLCEDLKQVLKVEHIDDDLKKYPTLIFYRQGEFIDLCRGPHIPHAGRIGAFKILSIAGAYWKNDAKRKQLQRLYATAFFSQKELDAYLHQLEEAKKRDHRVLGKQLKLFTISQQVGSGLILWMPKGATVRNILETFIKDELLKRGYQPVYTPHIGKLDLYRTSGHFPYYRDAQFPPMWDHEFQPVVERHLFGRLAKGVDGSAPDDLKAFDEHFCAIGKEYEEFPAAAYERAGSLPEPDCWKQKTRILHDWNESHESYLLKPMNCPHHIQIYKAEQRSYRDLPVRLAEFGTVYRFEQTGELSGMTRVRGFTQDDAHLFITPEQIEAELRSNIELVLHVLGTMGLTDYRVRVGMRDPGSDKYVGNPDDWTVAENTLIDVVKKLGMNYSEQPGEAAFYGPKIDFVVKDCIGREWQLGTVQLDYNLPKRFNLEYIGADNTAHQPIMIHRAPFGSMERFMGILIEHFGGAFPAWLAPEQARVMTVSDKFADYGKKVEADLRAAGFRIGGDFRSEKIGFKIREAQLEKIPYMLVIGDKEQTAGTVAVRSRSEGDLGAMPVAEFSARLRREVDEKRLAKG